MKNAKDRAEEVRDSPAGFSEFAKNSQARENSTDEKTSR